MNRASLHFMSVGLFVVILVGLFVSCMSRRLSRTDAFLNYPQQVNPVAAMTTQPEVTAANDNYAALLLFLQNNPSQTARFLADIQQKFFDKSCIVRSDIDFQGIVNFTNGAPFQ